MGAFFPPLPERRDFNYDRLRIWLGNQTISFQKVITGSLQVGQELTSSNFVTGVSGWKIDGDGNAEFNDVDIRGTLTAVGSGGQVAEITSGEVRWYSGNAEEQYPAYIKAEDWGPDYLSVVVASQQEEAPGSVVHVGGRLTLATWIDDPDLDQAHLAGGTGELSITKDGLSISVFGTASLPAFVWHQDSDTGMYRKSANLIGFSAGGTEKVTIGANGIKLIDGSAASPSYSFISDTDTGLFSPFADRIGFATGGTERMQLQNAGLLYNANGGFLLAPAAGSASAPAYSFVGDSDTGFYTAGSGRVDVQSNGTNVFIFDHTTGVGIRSTAIRDVTTGAAASVFINATTGQMARSTSSLKYKEGWKFADEAELAKITLPKPIKWHDEMGGDMLGFGVEHLLGVYPVITQDKVDGAPENYDPRALIAILSAKIKRLEALPGIKERLG